MRVILTPPLRTAFERVSIEGVYRNRLLDLFGDVAKAKQAHDEWHRLHQPPVHPWATYNAIARIEAGSMLAKHERVGIDFIVEFENE